METTNGRLAHALNSVKLKTHHVPGGGWLYLMSCEGFVKIGFAADVTSRFICLQTGCPFELKLLKVMPSVNMAVDEDYLHDHLNKYRHRGEWFKLPDDVLQWLMSLETPPQQKLVARLKRGWTAWGCPPIKANDQENRSEG